MTTDRPVSGLYPRYRPYIEAIASLLMMIGHALCFATLQNDAGSGSDDREWPLSTPSTLNVSRCLLTASYFLENTNGQLLREKTWISLRQWWADCGC